MDSTESYEPFLLVGEDDPADRDLIRRALADSGIRYEIVDNGEEVLRFLSQRGSDDDTPDIPDLVIVDLNMPRVDGRSVVQAVRGDGKTRLVPVVVFSSSNNRTEVQNCYDAGCSSYVVKPTDLVPFFTTVNKVVDYWLNVVASPVAAAN